MHASIEFILSDMYAWAAFPRERLSAQYHTRLPTGDSNCKRPQREPVRAYPSEPRAGMSPDENWTPESNLTTAGIKVLFWLVGNRRRMA